MYRRIGVNGVLWWQLPVQFSDKPYTDLSSIHSVCHSSKQFLDTAIGSIMDLLTIRIN